jgi:UDP-N-acetylmuramoyl-tripeptide--D-alanyl-D-alanine ligase
MITVSLMIEVSSMVTSLLSPLVPSTLLLELLRRGAQEARYSGPPAQCNINRVSIDTRSILEGALFVAVKGETTHGHDYLEQAFASGATVALVEDPALPQKFPHLSLLYVPSTLEALQGLAQWWRESLQFPLVGVAGSVGKTTTKELLRHILLGFGKGSASLKSFNNHLGVPLTLCSLRRDDTWGVIELGMNHAGELSRLSRLTRPHVILITCVAPEHMEFFSSLDEVADAEVEVLDGWIEPHRDQVLIVPDNDRCLHKALEKHRAFREVTVLTFGYSREATLRIDTAREEGLKGYQFELSYRNEPIGKFKSPLLGEHHVRAAAGALLTAKATFPSFSFQAMGERLASFEGVSRRLSIKSSGSKIIIDDSYNSSPEAAKAALHIAKSLATPLQKIGVVLGDMRELGSSSKAFHRELAEVVLSISPSLVATVGIDSEIIYDLVQSRGIIARHFENPQNVSRWLCEKEFDVLLIKGSYSVGLDRVVADIINGT